MELGSKDIKRPADTHKTKSLLPLCSGIRKQATIMTYAAMDIKKWRVNMK